MAQAVEAPSLSTAPKLGGLSARLQSWVATLLGPVEAPPPVEYTGGVVAYVGMLFLVATTLAAITVNGQSDGAGLAVVSVAIFLMAAASIRTTDIPGQHTFTATSFLGVGLALTLGPAGCLVAALAEASGVLMRFKSGAFRCVFNSSQLFLSTMAAWATYVALDRLPVRSVLWIGVSGTAAGLSFHLANYLMLSGVIRIAVGRPVRQTLRVGLNLLPYNVAYGYAAVGFVAMHDRYGPLGFTFSLAPVVALQVFLIVLARATRTHEAQRGQLMRQILEKSIQVERSYDQTLVALTHALDARDKETEGHSRRVVEYTRLVAVRLGVQGDELKMLCHGALLHDIGKIGVPDGILHKPAKLTEEEWEVMRRHPEIGAAMVEEVEYLNEARRIILHHHERWDGGGYPHGLAGTQIVLGARAFAVSDTFDAITQDRPYRRAQSFDAAREELLRHRGTQFDPDAVDAFLTIAEKELRAIAAVRSRIGVDVLAEPGRRLGMVQPKVEPPIPIVSRPAA
jgi:putative nucleotidyltransferase with HDIG domain